MAKSKPNQRNQKRKKDSKPHGSPDDLSPEKAQPFLERASTLLESGEAEAALVFARKSLQCLPSTVVLPISQLPVLELLGEIYIELGDSAQAREAFRQAADLDPEGSVPEEEGGGADKFLWLAQLSEDGGADSVKWFALGCTVLRREIGSPTHSTGGMQVDKDHLLVDVKKSKLANALCGAAEVYMTDLSWEEDAEARCESLVTEACLVAPESPEPLQTLASVRLSQDRLDDAKLALQRSLDLWIHLPPEHVRVPDFPSRISLARLLMEAGMDQQAFDVLDRLVAEDDSSVEAWYLGGWCLHLINQKEQIVAPNGHAARPALDPDSKAYLLRSRRWLRTSLRLYAVTDYEDERLRDHAEELVHGLDDMLGPEAEEDDGDEDDWEDEDDVDEDDDSPDDEMSDT